MDATVDGDTVLVANGVYASGGQAIYLTMTNRVAVNKPITVQSAKGPAVTIILGAEAPGAGNGEGAIRCAYVGSHAVLSGFGLTISEPPTQTEVQALRGKCEKLADAVRALSGLVHALRGALVAGGLFSEVRSTSLPGYLRHLEQPRTVSESADGNR